MAKTCSACGLTNPDSAIVCDCGRGFLASGDEPRERGGLKRWALLKWAGKWTGIVIAGAFLYECSNRDSGDLRDLKAKVIELEGEIDNLSQKVTDLEGEIGDVSQKAADLEGQAGRQ